MATKAKKGETKKKTPKKSEQDMPVVKPKLSEFIGKKLKDMGYENEDEKVLTIKFENGYNIQVGGDITLKVDKN